MNAPDQKDLAPWQRQLLRRFAALSGVLGRELKPSTAGRRIGRNSAFYPDLLARRGLGRVQAETLRRAAEGLGLPLLALEAEMIDVGDPKLYPAPAWLVERVADRERRRARRIQRAGKRKARLTSSGDCQSCGEPDVLIDGRICPKCYARKYRREVRAGERVPKRRITRAFSRFIAEVAGEQGVEGEGAQA